MSGGHGDLFIGEELLPVRLGLRMVKGLSNVDGARIAAAAMEAPFVSVEDVWRRSGVPAAAIEKLADADAFRSLGLDRRQGLWRVRGLEGGAPLPLFAAAEALGNEPAVPLSPLTEGREVVEDYRALQLTLRSHPLAFLRSELDRRGVVPAARLAGLKDGARVRIAGIVLIRQRPGKGNVTFLTLEDETGIANAIVWQRIFDSHRRIILASAMVGLHGTLQREGQVIHVIVDRLENLTAMLGRVGDMHFPHRPGPGDGAKGGGPDARERHRLAAPEHRAKKSEPVFRENDATTKSWTSCDGGLRIRSRDFH